MNCLLKHVIERKIKGTGRQGRRHKHILDDLKKRRWYYALLVQLAFARAMDIPQNRPRVEWLRPLLVQPLIHDFQSVSKENFVPCQFGIHDVNNTQLMGKKAFVISAFNIQFVLSNTSEDEGKDCHAKQR